MIARVMSCPIRSWCLDDLIVPEKASGPSCINRQRAGLSKRHTHSLIDRYRSRSSNLVNAFTQVQMVSSPGSLRWKLRNEMHGTLEHSIVQVSATLSRAFGSINESTKLQSHARSRLKQRSIGVTLGAMEVHSHTRRRLPFSARLLPGI